MSNLDSPYKLLNQIRDDARTLAVDSDLVVIQSAGVKNIAFHINGVNFFCASELIREVSECSDLLVVPQTKQWLRGVINSKGILYSVVDMAILAGYSQAITAQKGHLLILTDAMNQVALLVNRVIGFRYFSDLEKVVNTESKFDEIESLAAFVDAVYVQDEKKWYQLNIDKLVDSAQFREVQ